MITATLVHFPRFSPRYDAEASTWIVWDHHEKRAERPLGDAAGMDRGEARALAEALNMMAGVGATKCRLTMATPP